MGLITAAFKPQALSVPAISLGFPTQSNGGSLIGGSYQTFARQGYANNEIIFAAIELLATSAAEPHILGRRWRRARVTQPANQAKNVIDAEYRWLSAKGLPPKLVNATLVRNGFIEEVTDHPLIRLLNNPNPFMSRFLLWSTVDMDMSLAGNAYLLKVRDDLIRKPQELWRLRPDRVRIIPGDMSKGEPFVKGYEYRVGNSVVTFPPEDVIHFRTRNPLDDYYGMPPIMVIAGRIDIDNYMRGFLRTFFERGGTGPGSILTSKTKMAKELKDEIRDRFRRTFGGPAGWHEMLILDQAETTYTQLGLNRGLRDALPKEINDVQESRLMMPFGIPGSIVGLLIGYESSSYANKRQDWQVLWDVVMTPRLADRNDTLNKDLVPEFGGIDEVFFDLSQIHALQEDEDARQARERENFDKGATSLEEFRSAIGRGDPIDGEHYMVPTRQTLVTWPPPQASLPPPDQSSPSVGVMPQALLTEGKRGRPRIEDDGEARAIWEDATALREANPRMSWDAIAEQVGVHERTLRNYRSRFEGED